MHGIEKKYKYRPQVQFCGKSPYTEILKVYDSEKRTIDKWETQGTAVYFFWLIVRKIENRIFLTEYTTHSEPKITNILKRKQ